MNRREFLKLAGLGAAGVLGRNPVSGFVARRGQARGNSIRIALRSETTNWPIFPGSPTQVSRYVGEVIQGPASTLQTIPGSYLSPTIRLRKNDYFWCDFTNGQIDPTVVHWHGMNVPESMDGHPRYAISPGSSYEYLFQVINRAGTYWYHPHPDMMTGQQVYSGLAGMMIVSDPEEQALPLPRGDYDVPLLVQDRQINSENQYIFQSNAFLGTLGDIITVNGIPNYEMSAATRVYRFRIVNGSNARIYKLAWSDNTPLWVIGSDGGLLDKPRNKPFIILAPGERVELWTDFSRKTLGSQIKLTSQRLDGLGFGQWGPPPNNGDVRDIMSVHIERAEPETLTLPTTLTKMPRYDIRNAVNANNPRRFQVTFDGQYLFDYRAFNPLEVAENERVQNNTLELWEFSNQTSSQAIVHPIHVHGPQFQIYKRLVASSRKAAWDAVRPGYLDEGLKDIATILPGEKVQLLIKFGPYSGMFVYHCHNLAHEDMGMMRNYLAR